MTSPSPKPPTRLTVSGGPKAETIHVHIDEPSVKIRPNAGPPRRRVMPRRDGALMILLLVIVIAVALAYVIAQYLG